MERSRVSAKREWARRVKSKRDYWNCPLKVMNGDPGQSLFDSVKVETRLRFM